jgi:acetoacetyl-CoA reductase/3-oxoacyl-[acyl-carrier protein] reductase
MRDSVDFNLYFDFKGRVAVVTGGVRGIGRSIVDRLAERGCEVHVFDCSEPEESEASGVFIFHPVDVSSAGRVAEAVDALNRPVTLLVNNAGIARDRTIAKMSDEEWQAVIDVNLTGAFNIIRALAPKIATAGGGRIVNISSINGLRGKFGQANYAAAKAGMIGLTKTAAREFGPKGIAVNAVAPGMVLTEMTLGLPEEIRRKALNETVLGKLAEPEDIANAVLFLLSDAARMITGQVLLVDSGQCI